MTTITLTTPQEVHAGSRSRLYALLSQGFGLPSPSLHRAVQGGEFLAEVQEATRGLPYSLDLSGTLGKGMSLSFEELQGQYIALFDVGGPQGPPCSLCEVEYGGGRVKVMEDVLRFYHYFGLQLAEREGKRERPDHLSTELGFMHALTFKEAALLTEQQDVSAYRKAQRDFLRFHLADFLPEVARVVGPKDAPFYSDLARLGHRFCQQELAYMANL